MVCERVSHLFGMSCWLKANKWLWCNSAASGSIFSQFVFKILFKVLTSHISLPPQSWGSVQWIYSLAARRASLGGQLSLATFLVRSEEPVSRTDACDPSLEDAIYNLQNLGRRPRTCLYETVVWDIEPRMLRIRKKMVLHAWFAFLVYRMFCQWIFAYWLHNNVFNTPCNDVQALFQILSCPFRQNTDKIHSFEYFITALSLKNTNGLHYSYTINVPWQLTSIHHMLHIYTKHFNIYNAFALYCTYLQSQYI